MKITLLRIWLYTYTLTTWELYNSDTCLLNFLDSAIREDTLFLSIREQTFDCTIWERYLLGAILEMFLYLIIGEFEYLQAIRECSLSGLSLSEVVYYFLVWEGLLNIVISKVYYRVACGPDFPPHTITKDYFFLAIIIKSLLLTIMWCYLLD